MPCYYPIQLKKKDQKTWPVVPCGKCVGCRLEQRRQWAIRMMHEASCYSQNVFLTLTYRDDEIVLGYTHPTLVMEHLQNFMKRLRMQIKRHAEKFWIENEYVKFFACGEYGSESHRPHYHAIIFGIDFKDKKICSTENNNYLYHSDVLDSIWTHGYCTIGDVNFSSASYVAKYLNKRTDWNRERYEELAIEPEFATMSRKEGIGTKWFQKHWRDVYPSDELIVNGKSMRSIRFYDRKMQEEDPIFMHAIKVQRSIKTKIIGRKKLKIKETIKNSQLKNGSKFKL